MNRRVRTGCEFPLATSALCGLMIASCAARLPPSHQTPAPEKDRGPGLSEAELVERAARSFKQAIFYKPDENSMSGAEMTYAPLIVFEAGNRSPVGPIDPSSVTGPGDTAGLNTDSPPVYVTTSTTRLNGVEHEQATYVWRYPSRCGERGCLSHEGHGVRVTAGLDGAPLVWEALSTNDPRRVLYVSKSLEEAAGREFGEPLPGRRFAVERGRDEAREVVVVRVLDDGPMPMGPYVYVGASPREITTILCRCMPSQVDEFVATHRYRLVPLETLEKSPGSREPAIRWSGTMTWAGLSHREDGRPLDSLLRWPRQAP